MPDRMPDRMPEDMSDRMPEDMPDRMPEDLPDRMPEDMPDRMPDRMPEHMPEDMPEDMPDRMPEDNMSEYMPDRMPNRMPEDMSDRMPQDLPVRKCINVMVGITRSKVFFFVSKTLLVSPKSAHNYDTDTYGISESFMMGVTYQCEFTRAVLGNFIPFWISCHFRWNQITLETSGWNHIYYYLWWTNIAMENGHRNSGFSH